MIEQQWQVDGSTLVDEAIPIVTQGDVDRVVARSAAAAEASTTIIVRVNDEDRQAVVGADILVDGSIRGRTGVAGLAVVDVPERPASLAVRAVVHEEPSMRRVATDHPRRDPWSWRAYLTDLVLEQSGRDPLWRREVIDAGTRFVVTTVRRHRPVIGFNLVVSMEWSATRAERAYTRDRFLEMSQLLFNATNGQMLVERVHVLNGRRAWDEAHVRIHADRHRPSTSSLGGFADRGHIDMNPYDVWEPMVLLHEFGHLALGLHDEYRGPGGAPAECTAAKDRSPGDPFAEDGTRETCLMSGSRNPWQKFCSANPDNPHVRGTLQGDEACWTVIARSFRPPPSVAAARRWVLHRPDRALVDLLPDTGTPTGVATTGYPTARLRRSFIPGTGLQPRWQTSGSVRPSVCPRPVKVRVTRTGAPVGGVRVWLRSSDAMIEQGTTRTARKTYADGSVEDVGELLVRGAHAGDRVNAARPGGSVLASATVGRCDDVVTVRLADVVAPPPVIDTSDPAGVVVRPSVGSVVGSVAIVPTRPEGSQGAAVRQVADGAVVHEPGSGRGTIRVRSIHHPDDEEVALEETVSVHPLAAGATTVVRPDAAPYVLRARLAGDDLDGELVCHGSIALPVPTAEDLDGRHLVLPPHHVALVGPAARVADLAIEFPPSVSRLAADDARRFALLCTYDDGPWQEIELTVSSRAGALLGELPGPCTFVLVAGSS